MHNLQGRNGLRTRLLACGALGALVTAAALALPAQAETAAATAPATAPAVATQDQTTTTTTPATTPAPDTVVVVHGFRYSLQSAQNLKRKNDDVVDAIAAEDIGKLPDASIADAIVRLPGLAAQRNNSGRTQDISIDGLPSAMNMTLLNGFMQATTDNNRVTQFDQYPAEIMNSVVVYKIGDAALTGGAIGTVDMQTIRPLDYGKTALFVTAQGEYDTQGKLQPDAKDTGYRGSLTYITKLDDGKLGVVFGYSHITTPNQIISEHPYGYYAADDELEGGIQDEIRSDLLTRDSGVLTLQYRPTDNLEILTTTPLFAGSNSSPAARRPASRTVSAAGAAYSRSWKATTTVKRPACARPTSP
jgi:iron complex outermembrane receptor protein